MQDEDQLDEEQFEEIIADYIQRLENNSFVDEQALLAQHPQLAERLQSFFQLHQKAHSAFALGQPMEDAPLVQSSASALTIDRVKHGSSAWSWQRIARAEFPLEFGPYDLLEEINRGGMGIVYRAVHRELGRVVALKVMRAGEMATAEELHRFRTEAIASSALSHPNIIPIFEANEEHGLFYFTMAFIDGEDLETRMRREPIPYQEAAAIVLKTADAVAYAHRKNIIHRDIKPSNILLDANNEPFLADFGLANLQTIEEGVTATGQILGTPAYMPPEQASGRQRRPSPTMDVYALGAVLYAALTRQAPFAGPTPFDILLQVLDRQPPRPKQIDRRIPAALEAICLKAMAKEPEHRYSTATAMAADLRKFLRGEPVEIERPSISQRLLMWWRRESMLVTHLAGMIVVAAIMSISFVYRQETADPTRFTMKLGLVLIWGALSYLMQFLARFNARRLMINLAWSTIDVTIFTMLMFLADPPRGLLLVGYPVLIAASGLFYRVRFVVYMICVCSASMLLLATMIDDDPLTKRTDFIGIYLSCLIIVGLCVISMIRRVRGLSRYCGADESQ